MELSFQRKIRKKPSWRTNSLLTAVILLLLAGVGTAVATQNYLWRLPTSYSGSSPRAVLIDQLALDYPDPSFTNNVTQFLTGTGYSVDYVGPSTSAVDFFRQLPSKNYDLIMIRAHTGSSQTIITTQPYTKAAYVVDQLSGKLVAAQVENGPLYFAVTSSFVRQDMIGRFPGSTIILMGCAALAGTHDLASAFLDKGAGIFAGWNGPVTVIHMDASTSTLIRQVSLGRSLELIASTEISPDPVYSARLNYLSWNELVNNRINTLLPAISVGSLVAVLLVFGPLTIFIAPKISSIIEQRGSLLRPRRRTDRVRVPTETGTTT